MAQQDICYNTLNVDASGLVFTGQNFAFPATSTLAVTQGFSTIHRLPEQQVNIFDVTDSVEVRILASLFNAKINVVKTGAPGSWNASTNVYFDASSDMLLTDSLAFSSAEFKSAVASPSNVVSVGGFRTLYSDFANYVASYFGLTKPGQGVQTGIPKIANGSTGVDASNGVATGFSTLFSGEYGFNPNNGVFGPTQLYNIIQGDGSHTADNSGCNVLQGAITLTNLTKLLRYAVDSNCFGNRNPDPSSNTVGNAIGSSKWNYGVTDGFLAGDMIFVPTNGFAITLNLNINYNTTVNTYLGNNIGQANALATQAQLDASFGHVYDASSGTILSSTGATVNGQNDGAQLFATTVTNKNLLSRTLSCPLLIRLVDV